MMIKVKPNICGKYAVYSNGQRVTGWVEKHTAMSYAQDLKFEQKLNKRLAVSPIVEKAKKVKKAK